VAAEEALRIHLLDEIVAGDQLHQRALELAAQCASGAVQAQAMAKQAIDTGLSSSLEDGLRLERHLFERSFRTEDSQIGVASFLESGPGKARFTGR
jgi:enoyl-CoA hydratase